MSRRKGAASGGAKWHASGLESRLMAELELLDGVHQVDPVEWNALVGTGSPFLEWEWLASLEQAGVLEPERGWISKPIVVRDQGELVAACPAYLKLNSEGEFVFDWHWADAAERAGIAYYPKLLVGVPFTPVAGQRVLVRPGERRASWVRVVGDALRQLCDDNGLSSVHVNFCQEDEIEPLRAAGFDLRIGVQYQWRNREYATFEDYLMQFRSKRRNQMRRELRGIDAAGIHIDTLVGDAIEDDHIPAIYRFYLATLDKKYYGRQYLNAAFFQLIAERFRHRLCFVLARRQERFVAGTFNVQKEGVLYGRYWGADREIRNLHFGVAYYAAVDHCIRSGFTRFEPGAGGEFKRTRGFEATPTWSMHYVRDGRLERAIARFLEQERTEVQQALQWYEEHSALKPRVELGS